MADEGVGGLGWDARAGEEHTNTSSYNPYTPLQAVQTELSPSRAQIPIVQSSLDSTMHNTLSNTAATSISGSANPPHVDIAASDRQSLSRSMSRASSQSEDSIKITTISQEANQESQTHTRELGDARQLEGDSARYTGNMSSLDPVSDSSLNTSTNAVSSNNVPIQNDVQDQSSPNAAQNGITNTVPNLAAVIPDTGASSHNEYTAKPPQTLPAPSAAETNSAAKSVPPTPTTSAPRARLPHDRVGILEDRIKEDPRGDLEAWLSLIEEHRKRAKTDDARNVYERFLAVFPSAVCSLLSDLVSLLDGADLFLRQTSGLHMLKSRMKQESDMPWIRSYLELCRLIRTSLYGQCI